jgi:hypothetical protein
MIVYFYYVSIYLFAYHFHPFSLFYMSRYPLQALPIPHPVRLRFAVILSLAPHFTVSSTVVYSHAICPEIVATSKFYATINLSAQGPLPFPVLSCPQPVPVHSLNNSPLFFLFPLPMAYHLYYYRRLTVH